MNNIENIINERYQLQEEYLGKNKTVNNIIPLVSVRIATYQQAKYIGNCIDGVLLQKTTFPFEIIIGEDDSTDGTKDICIKYAKNHPDMIRLFLRDRSLSQLYDNHGRFIKRLNGTFNIMASRGKYQAFCEGDDYWTDPTKLQKQVTYLENNPDYALTTHKVMVVDENGNDLGRNRDIGYSGKGNRTFIQSEFLGGAGFHPSSWVYKSKTIKHLPEFIYYISAGDDVLMTRILQYGKGYCFNEIMSHYRIHGSGIWSTILPIERTINYIHVYSFARIEYPEYYKQYNVLIWARIKAAGYQLSLKNMRQFLKLWFNLPKFPYRFSIPVLLIILLAYGAKIIYVRLPKSFVYKIRKR